MERCRRQKTLHISSDGINLSCCRMEGGHSSTSGMLPGHGLDRLLPFATAQSQPQSSDAAAPPQQMSRLAFPAAYRRGKLPSPEAEPGSAEDGAAKRASASPWHRMKWTDSMVRLLVMVVYSMGDDDGGGSVAEGDQPAAAASTKSCSRKAAAAAATGALQLQQQQQQQKKKGKWRSVSRAMMEKGFFVSPQQCEDKFNDLNKRYKRVNDLLGKGTACRVVENHALLDTMDISPKAKEEARKLLNSKHLFFREMCAYHNAASGGGGGCGPGASSNVIAPPPPQDKQACLHHSLGRRDGGSNTNVDITSTSKEEEEDNYNEDYNDDDYDDDDEDYDEEDDNHQHHKHFQDDDEDDDSKGFGGGGGTTSTCSATKRRRVSPLGQGQGQQQQPGLSAISPPLSLSLCPPPPATSIQQLTWELAGLAGRGEEKQQRQWLKKKAVELEENRVGYQSRGLQLERQRLKWLRFSSNKENEMERMKLENDRLRLENDRMLLLLRQKELELLTSSGCSVPGQSNGDGLHHHLF